jgi:hypothetical protein
MKTRILLTLLLFAALCSIPAHGQAVVSLCHPTCQFFDGSGNVLSGGSIYTYAAGTTTQQATYTTSAGSTANQNPIVLNSAGMPPAGIYLSPVAYKFVAFNASSVQVWSQDNYSPWNLATFSPTYAIVTITGALNLASGQVLNWNSDLGLSRDSAGILDLGNGAQGDKSGTLKLSNVVTSTIQGPGYQKQIFTANGTFTIPAGITQVKVTVIGGGGGGAGCTAVATNIADGGTGAGTAIKWLSSLTPGNTLTVTVGGGGNGGSSGANNGSNGNDSTVASGTQVISTITGAHGFGGTQANGGVSGGTGGGGTGGDINLTGGGTMSCLTQTVGCPGGGTSLAGPTGATAGTGTPGNAPGGGGGGAGNGVGGAAAGGAGANGMVIFEWVN